MKTFVVSAVLCVFCFAGVVRAADKAAEFPESGFSIEPMDAPAGAGIYMPVMFNLPVTDGFAPNVNVQSQPYAQSLEAYRELSEKQFKTFKFTVVDSAEKDGALYFEYTGKMGGKSLHWYAKAIKKGDKVILATATALESQWDKNSKKLKACVDSLKLK